MTDQTLISTSGTDQASQPPVDPRENIPEEALTIDTLLDRDPLEFNDKDIDTMTAYYRGKRKIWAQEEELAAKTGKKTTSTKRVATKPKMKLDDLGLDLDLDL